MIRLHGEEKFLGTLTLPYAAIPLPEGWEFRWLPITSPRADPFVLIIPPPPHAWLVDAHKCASSTHVKTDIHAVPPFSRLYTNLYSFSRHKANVMLVH